MNKRVLFVEDDKVDQIAIQRVLDKDDFPHAYDMAKSVKEAKARINSEKYDLVVVDFNLGDGTCFDIFNSLENIPFIIVTGGGSEDIAVEAMKSGAADYLVKDPQRNYLTLLPSIVTTTLRNWETEQMLSSLLTAMGSIADSVYITDADSTIIFVNDAFCRTYGYDKEEIIGKEAGMISTEGKDALQRRKNGTTFPALLSRSTVKNSNGDDMRTVTVVHDITEQKKMELALEEALQKYSVLLDHVETKLQHLEEKP